MSRSEGPASSPEKSEAAFVRAEIEGKREALGRDRAISIDMRFSAMERESLERVRIECSLDQFDFYGPDVSDLKRKLEIYFSEMGENDPQDLSNISDIICRLSNDDFKIPRWHPDGKYYRSLNKKYKLVAAVKGAQTRFGEAIDAQKASDLGREQSENYANRVSRPELFREEDARIRRELANVIQEKKIGTESDAVIYLVGEEDAVLHSEPHITKPRIFFSVLPGSMEGVAIWEGRTPRPRQPT